MPGRQPKLASRPFPVHPVADARSMRGRIEVAFGSALPVYPPEPAPWQERPLEPDYGFVFIDSMPLRIREDGLMCSRKLHLILGILADGSKDILAFRIEYPAERNFWPAAMQELKARGLQRIQMVVAEDRQAVAGAIRETFPHTTVIANLKLALRYSLEALPLAERAKLSKDICRFFTTAARDEDFFELNAVRGNPDLTRWWRGFWREATAVLELPEVVRKLVCTTTAVESVVEKLRRRGAAKHGTFASREAAVRELVLALQDAKGAWRVAPSLWRPLKKHLFSGAGAHSCS